MYTPPNVLVHSERLVGEAHVDERGRVTFGGTAVDVAMFTGSTIDKPGVGYTLVPSVTGLTSATSVPLEVTTPAAQVALSSSASTITWGAGVSLSVAVSPDGGRSGTVDTRHRGARRIGRTGPADV